MQIFSFSKNRAQLLIVVKRTQMKPVINSPSFCPDKIIFVPDKIYFVPDKIVWDKTYFVWDKVNFVWDKNNFVRAEGWA